MQIRESAEDYLEAILVLSKKGGGVRSVDIATMLGVSKPSVSHAMKLLREDGYIAMDRYGTVTLMEKGAEIANRIYERHTVLTKMLEGLGVSADTARCDACKMEHDVSDESFEKIKEHLKEDPLITIAQVRDMFETSRKSAKPILEYMDSIKVTKKTGAESERVAY